MKSSFCRIYSKRIEYSEYFVYSLVYNLPKLIQSKITNVAMSTVVKTLHNLTLNAQSWACNCKM